jgi:hypothetical protein
VSKYVWLLEVPYTAPKGVLAVSVWLRATDWVLVDELISADGYKVPVNTRSPEPAEAVQVPYTPVPETAWETEGKVKAPVTTKAREETAMIVRRMGKSLGLAGPPQNEMTSLKRGSGY